MTAVSLQTHLKPTSKVVNHPDTLFLPDGTNVLGDGHFQFSNGLRTILIHVVLQEPPEIKIWGVQIRWIRRPLRFAAPADQPIRESVVQPLHRDIGCMWSCPILLEPLHISIHATTCPKYPPELVEHRNVTLLCDSDCILVCVFKPKWSDYAMLGDGHPGRTFHRLQGPLKHLVWGLCAPEHIVLAIDMPTEQKVCFVTEPNIIKKVRVLFDLVLEPPAHHNTFCHVSWCEFMLDLDPVWVKMNILDQDSLHWWTWNTQLLASSSDGLFRTPSDRISHRIHTVRRSYSQLPARFGWICLLVDVVDWSCGFKFVNPTINLAFLGIIVEVELPAIFGLHRFEWFRLQISSDAKYFLLFCPRHFKFVWLLIIRCYGLLFANLKNKKNNINIGRVISTNMGCKYSGTPCIYIYIYCYEFAPAGVRSAAPHQWRPSRPPDGQFGHSPSGTTAKNRLRTGI